MNKQSSLIAITIYLISILSACTESKATRNYYQEIVIKDTIDYRENDCYKLVLKTNDTIKIDTAIADDLNPLIEYKNNSELKFKTLYFQPHKGKGGEFLTSNEESCSIIPWEVWPIENTSELAFTTIKNTILIKNDSVILLEDKSCVKIDTNIQSYKSYQHRPSRDTIIVFDLGTVYFSKIESLCTDTYINRIDIKTTQGSLVLNKTRNLFVIEGDADNDNKKELYIMSYHSCIGRVEIIKVFN